VYPDFYRWHLGYYGTYTNYLTANTAAQFVRSTEESRQEIQKSGDEGSKVANSILDSVNAMMDPASKKKAALFGIVASV
jgi:hypothetical protein